MAAAENDITISCSSEYPDYVYNEKHDIWALVSLIAPCHDEDVSEDRAAMDIVAVMDKSGSMAGSKLKLVKLTLEFVLTQLKEKDRLALITYDTNVYVDFALMNMTKDNKEKALKKIRNIRDGSTTNLSGGLMKGLCQIINRPSKGKNDVASVLLFTDGLANHGITSVDGIKSAMKDPKKFDGPTTGSETHRDNSQAPAPHVSWMKRVFSGGSISRRSQTPVEETKGDTKEHESNKSSTTSADATVYTFGFGSDHDAHMLKEISDAGNGMYYFIETEDKIGESFAHCLGGLMSTVAQGIQLEITMETGVTIKDVHTTRPCERNDDQGVKVNIGDLQSEESRDIVLELSIDSVNAPYDTTPQLLFNSQVNYFNVISNNLEVADGSLSVFRPEIANVHDLTNVSAKLTKEKCRVGMTKVMKQAGDKAAQGDFAATKEMLRCEIDAIKNCQMSLAENQCVDDVIMEEYDAMVDDLEEYNMTADNDVSWNMKGLNLQSNLVQQYENQRSAMPDARAFKSKAKKGAVLRSKAFFK